MNPAAAVRGPKHVVTKGATPVLTPAEARKLLEHIDTGTLAGLRDLALFSVMLYSFARVSAVLGMRRQDYFLQGSRGWLRLHEKGAKRHDVPAHHRAAAALDEYLDASGLEAAGETLFQSVDRAGERLTGRALTRRVVLAMIKRRAALAGLPPSTCCHVDGQAAHRGLVSPGTGVPLLGTRRRTSGTGTSRRCTPGRRAALDRHAAAGPPATLGSPRALDRRMAGEVVETVEDERVGGRTVARR